MIRQCFIVKTGILFHKHQFKDIGLDPDTLYPHVLRRPPLPLQYTPDSFTHRFNPPINFAKNYKNTIVRNVDDEPFVNEEEEDMLDALAPMYDQLKLAKGWWVLECLPSRQRHQKEDDTWERYTTCVNLPSSLPFLFANDGLVVYRINLRRARTIPERAKNGIKVHRTVKIRMDADGFFKDGKYEPAAKLEVEPQWID